MTSILTQYFEQTDDRHYKNTRKIIVEALSTDEHHAIDRIVPKGVLWEVLDNGDIRYTDGHSTVILDPSDPGLKDRITEEWDLVVITI